MVPINFFVRRSRRVEEKSGSTLICQLFRMGKRNVRCGRESDGERDGEWEVRCIVETGLDDDGESEACRCRGRYQQA